MKRKARRVMEEVLRHELLALSRKSYADAKSAPRCVGWARGPGMVYYGGDRKIAVFRLNERVLDFIRILKNRIDLRHSAALELLPAAERERLGGFGCWIMI